jgi:FecR protein
MRKVKIVLLILLLSGINNFVMADDGYITYFEGEVIIRRANTKIEADFGLPVSQGDILETSNNSLLIIQLNSKGELKLKENTILELESVNRETSLVLSRGSVFSRVKKIVNGSFSIETPSMVAGVRGTEFFVAYGRTIEAEPDIWLCVNEGSVDVSLIKTGESVLVKEGEGINILSGNKLTEPAFYSWTEELNWNTDPAKGTVSDNSNLDSAYEDLLNQDYE